MVSFPPVSPARPYTPPLLTHTPPHAQPISFFSILSPAQYWVSSTNHLAPRYAVNINMNNVSNWLRKEAVVPKNTTKNIIEDS